MYQVDLPTPSINWALLPQYLVDYESNCTIPTIPLQHYFSPAVQGFASDQCLFADYVNESRGNLLQGPQAFDFGSINLQRNVFYQQNLNVFPLQTQGVQYLSKNYRVSSTKTPHNDLHKISPNEKRNPRRECRGRKRRFKGDRLFADGGVKFSSKWKDDRPLFCKICRVKLNAPGQAREHYEGRYHSRRVKLLTPQHPSDVIRDSSPSPMMTSSISPSMTSSISSMMTSSSDESSSPALSTSSSSWSSAVNASEILLVSKDDREFEDELQQDFRKTIRSKLDGSTSCTENVSSLQKVSGSDKSSLTNLPDSASPEDQVGSEYQPGCEFNLGDQHTVDHPPYNHHETDHNSNYWASKAQPSLTTAHIRYNALAIQKQQQEYHSEPPEKISKSNFIPPKSKTKDDSELPPSVYCKVCSVAFNSDKQAVQHYSGKVHSKRLRVEAFISTLQEVENGDTSQANQSRSGKTGHWRHRRRVSRSSKHAVRDERRPLNHSTNWINGTIVV